MVDSIGDLKIEGRCGLNIFREFIKCFYGWKFLVLIHELEVSFAFVNPNFAFCIDLRSGVHGSDISDLVGMEIRILF